MRVLVNVLATCCGLAHIVQVAGSGLTEPQAASQPARQVAIIGAGAAGSSTAYHLRQYADEAGIPVNITIFEKTDRIGGRSLTVNPFGNASQPVELGASIFIKKNHILYAAFQDFGLEGADIGTKLSDLMGIWDGEKFVFTVNTADSSWWIGLRVTWKYGLSGPRKALKLVGDAVSKFLNLYKAPFFPFRSLTQRVYELDLAELTGLTGAQYLTKNRVPEAYAHDLIQASTRVNYAANLDTIHALDTMVAQAAENAMAVLGGNWQLFQGMVERAGARVYLNTSVVSVTKNTSQSPKYLVTIDSPVGSSKSTNSFPFDDVVIATPYQFSKLDASGVLQHAIDEIPYVTLHVTLFSSPWELSKDFFNLTDKETLPGFILTTLAEDDKPASGAQGAGKAGFYSINILRKVVNPKNNQEEYLYKIFSPKKVTADFLTRLLGVKVPESLVDGTSASDGAESDHTGGVESISWYCPHVFYSYPKAFPRVTFQDPIVGNGLYYTSGMESFISTMETNALMGKNVARLLVDDIVGVASGGAVVAEMPDSAQHVMDL